MLPARHMDLKKRNELIEELGGQPLPHLVPIERFFDGNDDAGSIGCNLTDHPGIEIFKSTLIRLAHRGDVEAVYARIAELDPGEDSWPYTDTIFVVGAIDLGELRKILEPLQPDEVADGKHFGVPSLIAQHQPAAVFGAWWD
jgi:hypothetical protein